MNEKFAFLVNKENGLCVFRNGICVGMVKKETINNSLTTDESLYKTIPEYGIPFDNDLYAIINLHGTCYQVTIINDFTNLQMPDYQTWTQAKPENENLNAFQN